jgi:hypothetical protein
MADRVSHLEQWRMFKYGVFSKMFDNKVTIFLKVRLVIEAVYSDVTDKFDVMFWITF